MRGWLAWGAERCMNGGLVILAFLFSYLVYQRVEFMHNGGPIMILIVFVSVESMAIIFSKLRQLIPDRFPVDILLGEIFDRLERGRVKEAIDYCNSRDTSATRVFKAGIMKYDCSKDEIRETMEESLLAEVPLWERNLPFLSLLFQVAPVLGVLGTLMVLIKMHVVFEAEVAGATGVAFVQLSSLIWEALVVSVTGIVVALPALGGYVFFRNRIDMLTVEIEKGARELLRFLVERKSLL